MKLALGSFEPFSGKILVIFGCVALFFTPKTAKAATFYVPIANRTEAPATTSSTTILDNGTVIELTMQTPIKYCYNADPCGWAIYVASSHRVDYYMKNTCICPPNKECVKDGDDLSVSSLVYRCAEPKTPSKKREDKNAQRGTEGIPNSYGAATR